MFLWCCIATHAVLHIMASDNRRTDVEEVLCYCVLGVVFGAFIVAAAVLAHLLSITPNGHSMRFDYGGLPFLRCRSMHQPVVLLAFASSRWVAYLRENGKRCERLPRGVGWSCKPFVSVPSSAFTTTWWSCVPKVADAWAIDPSQSRDVVSR
jgi:hypothetical protein